jgi:GcrA cell cycle regulator
MWTDERVELLKKLWNDGLSASQIAAELGGINRNAVLGKVRRLGLPGRAKSPVSPVARQRKPRTAAMLLRVARPALRGNTALARLPAYEVEYEPDPQITAEIVPIGQRCTLLELSESRCRWPIGDPGTHDFFFCGGNTADGLPYCTHHARIAYQPLGERRRDKRAARA